MADDRSAEEREAVRPERDAAANNARRGDGTDRDEIADKHRWWNSATVEARMHAAFAGAQARAADPHGAALRSAALLLATLVGEVPGGDAEASDIASCRLMLDALKVSDGDLGKLAMWVEVAHADPRDLIAAAEYRRELGDPCEESRAADLAEYLAWCAGE